MQHFRRHAIKARRWLGPALQPLTPWALNPTISNLLGARFISIISFPTHCPIAQALSKGAVGVAQIHTRALCCLHGIRKEIKSCAAVGSETASATSLCEMSPQKYSAPLLQFSHAKHSADASTLGSRLPVLALVARARIRRCWLAMNAPPPNRVNTVCASGPVFPPCSLSFPSSALPPLLLPHAQIHPSPANITCNGADTTSCRSTRSAGCAEAAGREGSAERRLCP